MATIKLDLSAFRAMVNGNMDAAADTRCVLGDENIQVGEKDAGWFGRGKITKQSSTKTQAQQNNEVRTALLTALAGHYGKKEIPPAVMKALVGSSLLGSGDMKTDSKGNVVSGRPLTMRRIKAVLTAVDESKDVDENKAVDESKDVDESDDILADEDLLTFYEGTGFTDDGDHYVFNGKGDQLREQALSILTKVCSSGNVHHLFKVTGEKIVGKFLEAVTEWVRKQPDIKVDADEVKAQFDAFLNEHGEEYGFSKERRDFPKGAQFFNAFLEDLKTKTGIVVTSSDLDSIAVRFAKKLGRPNPHIDLTQEFMKSLPMQSFKFHHGVHKFEYMGGKTIFDREDKDSIANMPANFALSQIFDKNSDKPLMTVLRCGMASTYKEDSPKHYETIAKAMILKSQMLMKKIDDHTGEDPVNIQLPMFMFNAGDDLWRASDQIQTFTVTIGDKTVKVEPTFHELYVPGSGCTGKYFMHCKKTLESAEALLALAKERLPKGEHTDKIIDEVAEGILYLKSLSSAEDPKIKEDHLHLQAYLCQLSARMAFLASESGLVPCINCGHGRDRTGILNMLVQMCATGKIPPLTKDLSKLSQETKRELSRMLVATGNFTIALQTSVLGHPINLFQSHDGVECELHDLFDIEELKKQAEKKGFGSLVSEID